MNPQNQLLIERLGTEVISDLFGDGIQGGRNLLFETWGPPLGSDEAESLMDFTQAEKAEAAHLVEQAVGLDAKHVFGLGVTLGRVIGRRDAKKSHLVEDSTDQPDLSVIVDPPTSGKRLLTEQDRVELCEDLGISPSGYRRREWAILEKLQKQNDDESLKVIELFEDHVIYESRSGIFRSGYFLIENSVKLLDAIRLEGTAATIEEQLCVDRKKKFFERKVAGLHNVKPGKVDESRLTPKQREDRVMAGLLSEGEKSKSLLVEQKPVDEATLTPRQKKDREFGLMFG